MKLVSVNVGLPREITWKGKIITTGIFKEPVAGSAMMRTLNLEGDGQADLSVHGGAHKAVYGYPSEHYEYWQREFPAMQLPWGMFGENLTVAGLLEETVYIGDRYRIGSAEVRVTQPRLPCYKLGIKFGRVEMEKRFLASGRVGFYFAVLQEGVVKAGDHIELVSRAENSITIVDITRLYVHKKDDLETMQRIVQIEGLSDSWRTRFQERIDSLV